MAECNESDEEFFIRQSKFKSTGVGSDTDDLLSGILDLEERIREDKSEDLFSDNSSVEQELLTSTVHADNELLRERFACPHGEKDLENILGSARLKSTESKTRWAVNLFSKWQRARSGNEKGERFNTPLLEMTNEELGKALSYFIVEVPIEAGSVKIRVVKF